MNISKLFSLILHRWLVKHKDLDPKSQNSFLLDKCCLNSLKLYTYVGVVIHLYFHYNIYISLHISYIVHYISFNSVEANVKGKCGLDILVGIP